MIRVVVTGSECTGKTTLATAIASHYGVRCLPEFARQFVLAKGAPPDYADVEAIARGQIEQERRAASSGIVILDTDLLSTVVYSRHYYSDCPAWIEEALDQRPADLYLLAGIDVPWVPDGDQRDRGGRREEMHELFRRGLLERGVRFLDIHGSRAERLHTAISAIDRLTEG